jgi:glycosyltransferase involved in cell wall biosynthesis
MSKAAERGRWLFVHQNSELYGADRVLVEAATAIAAYADVQVCAPSPGSMLEELSLRGVPNRVVDDIYILRKSTLRPSALPGALRGFLRSVRSLRRIIISEGIDAIYVNTITLPAAIVAGRLSRIRVVVHIHEAETQSHRLVQKALLSPLLLSTQVLAISGTVEKFLASSWPRLAARTSIVRNPVRAPQAPFSPLPPSRPDELRVITPGRWSPRKGIDLVIEACALARDHGIPVQLNLLGSIFPGYEWYERQLREQAASRLPDTQFSPFAKDPDQQWRLAHITVVPSRIEPYGLVAAESMVRGRITIVSAVEGLLEIVDDGVTGWAVAPDAGAIAAAIIQRWAEWEASATIAERGRLAASEWTTERFAARLCDVLELR